MKLLILVIRRSRRWSKLWRDCRTIRLVRWQPGAAALMSDEDRWKKYVNDALIETSISKDILMLTRVDKPALLREFFELGCLYSGQVLSYQDRRTTTGCWQYDYACALFAIARLEINFEFNVELRDFEIEK